MIYGKRGRVWYTGTKYAREEVKNMACGVKYGAEKSTKFGKRGKNKVQEKKCRVWYSECKV